MPRKNKQLPPLFDANRLNWLILKGQQSYSDGRHAFYYEQLVELFRRLEMPIHTATVAHFNKSFSRMYRRSTYETKMMMRSYVPYFPWRIEVSYKYKYASGGIQKELVYPCSSFRQARANKARVIEIETAAKEDNMWEDFTVKYHFTPRPKPPTNVFK